MVLLAAWVALQWEENCSFWLLLGDLNEFDFFRCQTLLERGTVVKVGGMGREVLHKILPVR